MLMSSVAWNGRVPTNRVLDALVFLFFETAANVKPTPFFVSSTSHASTYKTVRGLKATTFTCKTHMLFTGSTAVCNLFLCNHG